MNKDTLNLPFPSHKDAEDKLESTLGAAAKKMKDGGKLTDEEWAEIAEKFSIFRMSVNSTIEELREGKIEMKKRIKDMGYEGPPLR